MLASSFVLIHRCALWWHSFLRAQSIQHYYYPGKLQQLHQSLLRPSRCLSPKLTESLYAGCGQATPAAAASSGVLTDQPPASWCSGCTPLPGQAVFPHQYRTNAGPRNAATHLQKSTADCQQATVMLFCTLPPSGPHRTAGGTTLLKTHCSMTGLARISGKLNSAERGRPTSMCRPPKIHGSCAENVITCSPQNVQNVQTWEGRGGRGGGHPCRRRYRRTRRWRRGRWNRRDRQR